jgi:hypothetical protein
VNRQERRPRGNTIEAETVRMAAAAIENEAATEQSDILTLSNGIQLKLRKIPSLLLLSVSSAIEEPEIPQAFIEDDQRWEANPNDPDYLKALRLFKLKEREANIKFLLGRGTQLLSVPEGKQKPEDDGWLEELREYQDIPADNPTQRYISWVRFYALEEDADLVKATVAVMRMTGVMEDEVATAIESFRSGTVRQANNGSSAPDSSTNGNNVPVASARPGY